MSVPELRSEPRPDRATGDRRQLQFQLFGEIEIPVERLVEM